MRLYDIKSKFTTKEFECKCGCGFGSKPEDIDQNLITKLNMMRILYDKPMVVTSGARCLKYNKKIGGVPSSAHLPHYSTKQCRAVDIMVLLGSDRSSLLDSAYRVGIDRIGIAGTFIHLDVAWDLPTPATFLY